MFPNLDRTSRIYAITLASGQIALLISEFALYLCGINYSTYEWQQFLFFIGIVSTLVGLIYSIWSSKHETMA